MAELRLAELGASLVAELVAAVEAMLGGAVSTPASEAAPGVGWLVTATASGDMSGTVAVWMDHAGAGGLAARMLGTDDNPDDAAVADLLAELCAQAAGSLSLKDPYRGLKLAFGPAEAGAAPAGATLADLKIGDHIVRVAVGGTAVAAVAVVESAPAAAMAAPLSAAPLPSADKLDVVLDIELPLVVRFARTVMTLKSLSALGPGSIVDMERSPDEPVQLLVGERVIARGEVVVVAGNYGVRVTDLLSPTERVRLLEA